MAYALHQPQSSPVSTKTGVLTERDLLSLSLMWISYSPFTLLSIRNDFSQEDQTDGAPNEYHAGGAYMIHADWHTQAPRSLHRVLCPYLPFRPSAHLGSTQQDVLSLRIFRSGLWLVATWTVKVEARKGDQPPKGDPFIDPKHDPWNPLKYIASNILTGVAFAIFLLIALSQTFCHWRWGARWMLAMVIGSYAMALGFGIRFVTHTIIGNLHRPIPVYRSFTSCFHCRKLRPPWKASARHLDCVPHLAVPARLLTRVFVTSDIITFLIQACGGGVSAAGNDPHTNLVSSRIFLTGLAIQLAAFFTFFTIYVIFLCHVKIKRQDVFMMDSQNGRFNDWRTLAAVLVVSCIGILVRSVFRAIEASESYAGHLTTTESFFYAVDTLPLIIAVGPFWPGRFIPLTP